jgi:phosphoketolase
MLSEFSDVSRVLFPPDYNTASVVTDAIYQTHGQIWTMVVPKYETAPDFFTIEEAQTLLKQGAVRLDWAGYEPDQQQVVLTAMGSYQLEETVKASNRLAERGIAHSVIYMIEPGRFREPRSPGETAHVAPDSLVAQLYPDSVEARIFISHTRPEPVLGALKPLDTGKKTKGLGYLGHGGTLTAPGLLFINRSAWAHILVATAQVTGLSRDDLLTAEEIDALDGKVSPEGIIL